MTIWKYPLKIKERGRKRYNVKRKERDRKRYNADYFRTLVDLMPKHNRLMAMSMRDWPESLKQAAKAKCDSLGFCGDVLACAVAEWLAIHHAEVD